MMKFWWIAMTNRLFGWHWVLIEFAGSRITRLVRKAPNGQLCYKCYGVELLGDRPFEPLTWQEDAANSKVT